MENDHLKQMESIYIKETHMIDNLYSKYCSGLKNAEFQFGNRYKMDILSKQYETVEEFLTDNKHYVDKLKEINNYASNKAKENKTIRRGRPSHTE